MPGSQICLIGNGGHARSLRDVIDGLTSYSVSLGGQVVIGEHIEDTRRMTPDQWARIYATYDNFLVGIGQIKNPHPRSHAFELVRREHPAPVTFITLIAKDAYVSRDSVIGEGVQVMHHAFVNSGVKVGMGTIINTGAIIEHDCEVGEFCHIAPGAVVSGEAKIGSKCFVGANATVLNQIKICNNVILGAGSVACCDITEPGVYRGNPAGRVK